MARPLVVTDRGLAGTAIVAAARERLAAAGLGGEIFDAVDPNPGPRNLNAGIEALLAAGP